MFHAAVPSKGTRTGKELQLEDTKYRGQSVIEDVGEKENGGETEEGKKRREKREKQRSKKKEA